MNSSRVVEKKDWVRVETADIEYGTEGVVVK